MSFSVWGGGAASWGVGIGGFLLEGGLLFPRVGLGFWSDIIGVGLWR